MRNPQRTVILIGMLALSMCDPSFAFVPSSQGKHGRLTTTTRVATSSSPIDDDISRLQLKARQLLEKSKAKLAAKEKKEAAAAAAAKPKDPSLPFFASTVRSRDSVIKSRNEETGLITADGERMAAISEQEEWEVRSLYEVFENEIKENEDVYSLASQQLAARDVAASIFDLRKKLQTDDYKAIFNKRNPFIGEDN